MSNSKSDSPGAIQQKQNRSVLLMMGLGVLVIVASFWFWHDIWFGRHLSDGEMSEYFNDSKSPRKIQHALSQIADRIIQRDTVVQRWYPRVIESARNNDDAVRMTAAWVMGHDNTSEQFHQSLLILLSDSNLLVRRNAALSLVRFGDNSGHEEILNMLRPMTIKASDQGRITINLSIGQTIGVGDLVCRIRGAGGEVTDVRAPLVGEIQTINVKEGAFVNLSDPLISIAPDQNGVWEALRGLYVIGTPEDLNEIERHVLGVPDMPETVRQQALGTAEAIRTRSARNSTR
jgi:hypothetical protein